MFDLNAGATKYGEFGGVFVPEVLIAPIKQLAQSFNVAIENDDFKQTLQQLLTNYAGRATPLTEVAAFAGAAGGSRLFLKREDLLHTGAHKINNALGQCLLAKKMAKTRVIAETGAGQHGVATATACAHLGLQCVVYMGEKDIERQRPNVEKMKLLGAEIVSVAAGSKTLKDAVNAALRDWAHNFANSHYCIGSALGPYPYPQMVEFFQKIIGEETKNQCQQMVGKNPDVIIACVGGGSNAIGIFSEFINDNVQLIGVEAGGYGSNNGEHAARIKGGKRGVLHGCYSYVLQDDNGQIAKTHSISAGLDYPMIGPRHAQLYATGRASYEAISDDIAVTALKLLARTEGIIAALESSHALGYYLQHAKDFNKDSIVVINLSGRGDKDLPQLQQQGKL